MGAGEEIKYLFFYFVLCLVGPFARRITIKEETFN